MNLDAQFGTWLRNIDAVRKPLHMELLGEQSFRKRKLADCNHQIEAQTDQRIGIRVHTLPADYAIPNSVFLQKADQILKEV